MVMWMIVVTMTLSSLSPPPPPSSPGPCPVIEEGLTLLGIVGIQVCLALMFVY
jgi:hypothetical protein